MSIQYIIVIIIGLVALYFLIRSIIRLFSSGKDGTCGGGCSGCELSAPPKKKKDDTYKSLIMNKKKNK